VISPLPILAEEKSASVGRALAASRKPLTGIVPPMVTPLLSTDELDVAGVEHLLEHILAGGVHGLFILGTSGEGTGLSYRLRKELIRRVCRYIGGKIPVLVGITDTSFTEAVSMAQSAADFGADAVVTAGPFYLPTAQPELVKYIQHLVREIPLPLYIYNMPQLTKVHFAPETLRAISQLEKVVGLKDSSGDMAYFDELLQIKRTRPDWSVLVGPEHLLLDSLRRGGDGGVNGGANFHPKLFVTLYDAVQAGDQIQVEKLQEQLLQLGQIYRVGQHASGVVKGMKCACSLLGLCADRMAEPFEQFHEREREQVRAILVSLKLLPA
jgi:2-dehydro-3-deoxy-D-pentonate aldolase